ncbi:VOC family protein [Lacticaseibacillus saniviri]
MQKMVFVNLPVADLARATKFYEALGFTKNPMFSDENASSMVWSQDIYVMLLTHDFYKKFLKQHTLADTTQVSGTMIAFALESIDAVKAFAETAKQNGGDYYHVEMGIPESQMYELEVTDPDGNILSVSWMNMPETKE